MHVRGPALILFLALLGGAAHGDERAVAKEHFFKGSKAFDLGLYEEAITEYQAAYKAKDDPALLYNIAQSHRLAGHASEALRFYKVFLSKVPHSPNRPEVENKIAELEKLVEQQKKAKTELPPDQVKPLDSSPRPEPTATPTTPPPVAQTTPEPQPQPELVPPPTSEHPVDLRAGRTKKIAGLAVIGVGVAALATGAALTALSSQYASDLGVQYDPAKESSQKTFNLVGPVLLGVGGAAAVAGAVVTALGFRQAKAARVSVLPTVGPRLAGVAVEGRF